MICKLCTKEIKNSLGLSSHLKHNHNEYTVKSYYDTFYKKENEGICICGKATTFNTFNSGYRKFCSSKCAQNSEIVRHKILSSIIKYDDEFKKTGFCIEKPHVYRYDFEYNGNIYHYVGSTIYSQVDRAHNRYTSFISNVIKIYGVKEFLLKYCTIVKWFDNKKDMTDFEEELNIKVKEHFGEEYVLSKANGRKPSNECIQAAIQEQRKNGSWNKGKNLSNEHKKHISKGISEFNIHRGKIQMIDCINQYLYNPNNEKLKSRIQQYIRIHYDKDYILSTDTINDYLNILINENKNF